MQRLAQRLSQVPARVIWLGKFRMNQLLQYRLFNAFVGCLLEPLQVHPPLGTKAFRPELHAHAMAMGLDHVAETYCQAHGLAYVDSSALMLRLMPLGTNIRDYTSECDCSIWAPFLFQQFLRV